MPKITIDPDKCIGCSTCTLIDPETYYLDQTDFKAKIKKQPEVITEAVRNGVESYPVGAITIDES